MTQPNVLLITIDALRADALPCYGNGQNSTPYLDRLAMNGTRFEVAITNGDHTKSAFPAIMTSTYGSMYSGCLGPLSSQRYTLAQAFRDAGYRTVGVSTTPLLSRELGYDRGFEHFSELPAPAEGASWYRRPGAQRVLRQATAHQVLRLLGVDTGLVFPYAPAARAIEVALECLPRSNGPFMMWLHLMDAHWPYHPQDRGQDSRELAESWRDWLHVFRATSGQRLEQARLQRVRGLYEAAIQRVDEAIGRMLASLEQRGMLGNTLVAVTSDHGEEFYEHGSLGHTSHHLYEEILRVPLILAGPTVPRGHVVDEPVQSLDLAPTLLGVCGIHSPPQHLGASLAPCLRGEGPAPATTIISEMWWNEWIVLSARTAEHKLIWRPRAPQQYEVYHLGLDPGEQKNMRGEDPGLEQRLLDAIMNHTAMVRPTQTDVEEMGPDADLMERLAALGYVEGY